MNQKKKYYPTIDLCKVLCAILVVSIHCLETRDGEKSALILVDCFAQQAVPFFFIVSGFLFTKGIIKASDPKKYMQRYCAHLLAIYFGWIIIWMPYNFMTYHNLYPDRSYLYLMIIIGRRVFLAGYSVYWYLLILVESVIVIYFAYITNRKKALYVLAVLGFVFGLLYDMDISIPIINHLYRIIYIVFSWSNNMLMKGLPYLTLGMWFAEREGKDSLININRKIVVFLYGLVSLANIYMYISFGYNQLYPMEALLLFIFAIAKKTTTMDRKTIYARELSGVIYFLHTVVLYLIIDQTQLGAMPFWGKYILTLGGCCVLYPTIKKLNISFINKLVNI